jgi:hypothetical protein
LHGVAVLREDGGQEKDELSKVCFTADKREFNWTRNVTSDQPVGALRFQPWRQAGFRQAPGDVS